MDSDAFNTFVRGTTATCATASLATAVYAAAKQQNVAVMALASAIKGTMTGATFFGIREFAVSPILVSMLDTPQYKRRRLELEGRNRLEAPHTHRLTWSDMRMHNLLDSTISGALTGGILYSYQRGLSRLIPGATTTGLICAALQLAANEAHIQHVKFVSRRSEEAESVQTTSQPTEPKRPLSERIFDAMGMSRVSDEDYLKLLKHKREGYLRRIAVLEAERARASEQSNAGGSETQHSS